MLKFNKASLLLVQSVGGLLMFLFVLFCFANRPENCCVKVKNNINGVEINTNDVKININDVENNTNNVINIINKILNNIKKVKYNINNVYYNINKVENLIKMAKNHCGNVRTLTKNIKISC